MAYYSHQTFTPQGDNVSYQDSGNRGMRQHHHIDAARDTQPIQMCRAPTTQQQIYAEPVTENLRTFETDAVQQLFFQQYYEHNNPPVQNQVYNAHQILQHTEKKGNIPQHARCPAIFHEEHSPAQPATQAHVSGILNITCKSKSDLSANKTGHTVKNYHKCDVCDKSFTCKSALLRHYRIHTGVRPYACDLCQRKFSLKRNLKEHRLTHTGEKPHECEVCHKAFSQKHSLKEHRLTHTGEKPHVCDVCNKAFSHKCILKTHLLIHTGEKPHVCEICNKGFSDKSNLNKHSATHLSQERRVCSICNIGFSQNIKFKKHIMVQNGRKNDICETCIRNMKEVKDQEDQLNIHESELDAFQQKVNESKVGQQQQKVNVDSQVIHIQSESDNCETTIPGNIDYHEQALINTEQQLYVANDEELSTIDQLLTQINSMNLNIATHNLNSLNTIDHQSIEHHIDQDLPQIGHQTLDQIAHPSLLVIGQQPSTAAVQQSMVANTMPSAMNTLEDDQDVPLHMPQFFPCDQFQKQFLLNYNVQEQQRDRHR